MDALIAAARASAAAAPAAALERIRQRLERLGARTEARSAARWRRKRRIAATRADVQEELERLAAHAARTAQPDNET